jgi:hypothetical protein
MSMARIRDHLPQGALPEAVSGQYRMCLPTGDVDVWRLDELASGPLSLLSARELHHLLTSSEPYAGISASPLLDRSRHAIRHTQRQLLERVATEVPELLGGQFPGYLRQHLNDNPFNESILALAARFLALTGDRRAALELLCQARRRFAEVGLVLGQGLDDIECRLLEGQLSTEARPLPPAETRRPLPPELADLRTEDYVGPQPGLDLASQILVECRESACIAVTGPSGVGKSRLCAELAVRGLERHVTVIYLAPTAASSAVAFSSMLGALPAFSATTGSILVRPMDDEVRRVQLWQAARRAIGLDRPGNTVLMIVDDCQWLDHQTAELLADLIRAPGRTRLVLVLTGSGDADLRALPRSLSGRHNGIRRLNVELHPFGEEAMRALVETYRPDLSEPVAERVARDLLAATSGLPGVARLVLANLDELNMIPNLGSLSAGSLLDSVVRNLSDQARRVGAVGSILGPDFDLVEVEQVLGIDETSSLVAIKELVRSNLVQERSITKFRITHVLAGASLVGAELKGQVARWHKAAAELFADDLHRQARHQAAAFPWLPATTSVASLLRSAEVHLAGGRHQQAAHDYRTATVLNGGSLAPVDGGRFARALDLLGEASAAKRVRQTAFEASLEAAHFDEALRIATSGLPEALRPDGDPDLVANLFRIDPVSIERAENHNRCCHLCRQLTLLGRTREARSFADQALRLAVTDEERARAAHCRGLLSDGTRSQRQDCRRH